MKCLIILILLLTLVTESKAEIYRWIDENGQIHYSDEKGNVPKNADKRLEEIKKPQQSKPARITSGYFERIYRTPISVPKYWKDPITDILYTVPVNEPQILKDRQRVKQQQIQLETAQATAGTLILLIIIAIGTYIILSIISFFDILKSKFEGNDKLIWVLVILCVPIIGEIAYLTIGRKQKITKAEFD